MNGSWVCSRRGRGAQIKAFLRKTSPLQIYANRFKALNPTELLSRGRVGVLYIEYATRSYATAPQAGPPSLPPGELSEQRTPVERYLFAWQKLSDQMTHKQDGLKVGCVI